MRKFFIILGIIFLLIWGCKEKQKGVERIIVNGVEIIVNHLEPYKIKGERTDFILKKEFIIDTENEELAKAGVDLIRDFDVDSEGNIYCVGKEVIFKFDKRGNFIKTIGRKGQGPGEFLSVLNLRITKAGEISFYDSRNGKFLFFSREGDLVKEIKNTSQISSFGGAVFLDNGNFLFEESNVDPDAKQWGYYLILLNKDFIKIKDLNGKVFKENPFKNPKYNLFDPYVKFQIFKDKIYTSNSMKDDLEIEIYDFNGKLIKKIKKESKRVKIPEDYKQKIIKSYKAGPIWNLLKNKVYFQDYFPPFKDFYVDDNGKIYVETYEKGEKPNENIIDIFNSEGIFIGRKSLPEAKVRKFKNNRLYCVYEKESGFEKFIAYRINWKKSLK